MLMLNTNAIHIWSNQARVQNANCYYLQKLLDCIELQITYALWINLSRIYVCRNGSRGRWNSGSVHVQMPKNKHWTCSYCSFAPFHTGYHVWRPKLQDSHTLDTFFSFSIKLHSSIVIMAFHLSASHTLDCVLIMLVWHYLLCAGLYRYKCWNDLLVINDVYWCCHKWRR